MEKCGICAYVTVNPRVCGFPPGEQRKPANEWVTKVHISMTYTILGHMR